MKFVVFATDKPGSIELRERTRPDHRRHLRDCEAHAVRVVLAGPILEASGEQMNGTLLIVEADTIDAVTVFVAADPYSKAGLFARVDIRPWKCTLGRIESPIESPVPEAVTALR